MLLAHLGKIDAAGATRFGGLMLALAVILSIACVARRVRAGKRPYWAGAVAGLPFGLLAAWDFGFAVACRWGADPPSAWRAVVFGMPLSLWGCLVVLRRARVEA